MARDLDVSCELVARRLDDYLDRELDDDFLHAIRAHIQVCEACAQSTAFEEHVLSGLKEQLRRVAPPPALVESVRAIVRTEQR
jgi:anti-sigma factor (TIGR02949 family)